MDRDLAGTRYFKVHIQDDSLVVYTPSSDPSEVLSRFEKILGPFSRLGATQEEWLAGNTTYVAMLRFTLVDADEWLTIGRALVFEAASTTGSPWLALGRLKVTHESFFPI